MNEMTDRSQDTDINDSVEAQADAKDTVAKNKAVEDDFEDIALSYRGSQNGEGKTV